MPNLYMIAGCNGAGKTTASFTVLPEILNCREFVNADEIARGLSPFQPESVALEAGRIMLHRIEELMLAKKDFALETTLSTRSYVHTIKSAQEIGYTVTLVYFWLNTPELAVERVHARVLAGGHNIPYDVILRRYQKGIENLFKLYISKVDRWMLVDNSESPFEVIAKNKIGGEPNIYNEIIWTKLNTLVYGKG